jgi:hypothetical protein
MTVTPLNKGDTMTTVAELLAPMFVPGARYELTAPVENPCADRRHKGRSPLICERTLPAGLRFTVTEYGLRDGRDELFFAFMHGEDESFISKVGEVAVQVPFTEEEEFAEKTGRLSSYYAGLAMYQAALRLGVDKATLWREFARRGEEK